MYPFVLLPDDSFGLRVLSLPGSRSVCPCVRVSITGFIHAITRDPFKLGWINLDRRCTTLWVRCLLFLGHSTLTINAKLHYTFVRMLTRQPQKLWSPYLYQRCKIPMLRAVSFFFFFLGGGGGGGWGGGGRVVGWWGWGGVGGDWPWLQGQI